MNGKDKGIGAGVGNAWDERMRLIRLRRKNERWNFRDELKIIPKWLKVTLVVLFVIAEIFGALINLNGVMNEGRVWPEGVPTMVAFLAVAGVVALGSAFVSLWVLLIAYVNRDAKRRGMNSTLWTLLCLILLPSYFVVGFIIYFLARAPLPYACPRCSAPVGPHFNFCPNCKCDLHPTCPNCKREVVETDHFCPNCGTELSARTGSAPIIGNS